MTLYFWHMSLLSFASCSVPVAPVRATPGHRAEQITQLLFGERATILEENDQEWARIRIAWDGYEGWCKKGQLTLISNKEFKRECRKLAGFGGAVVKMAHGETWLPAGAELHALRHGALSLQGAEGKFKGQKIAPHKATGYPALLREYVLELAHAPYQWGGRTAAGIDCSGLVQLACKLCNIALPRDASQQVQAGWPIDFLQEACCGDLAFFDNAEGNIVHVGLLLDTHTIVHATDTAGCVVTDRIDNGGIISTLLKKRTHRLRVIRRILPEA